MRTNQVTISVMKTAAVLNKIMLNSWIKRTKKKEICAFNFTLSIQFLIPGCIKC